jgi:hypothetical protein
MRLEDLLPAGTEAEWTCGHVGGAHCAECYRALARRAHELADENQKLRGVVAGFLVSAAGKVIPRDSAIAAARESLHLGNGAAYDIRWP